MSEQRHHTDPPCALCDEDRMHAHRELTELRVKFIDMQTQYEERIVAQGKAYSAEFQKRLDAEAELARLRLADRQPDVSLVLPGGRSVRVRDNIDAEAIGNAIGEERDKAEDLRVRVRDLEHTILTLVVRKP